MGTHPIFESDFDCLTEPDCVDKSRNRNRIYSVMERLDWSKVSLTSYTVQNVGLSFLTRSVTYPLSLMKTRLQNQDASNRQYRGMIDCGRKIIHREGIRGFFKGGFQIFLQLPASTLYLATLDMSLSVLPPDMNPAGRGFVSGAAAGMVAQCYFVPLDVITQRMQTYAQVVR